MLDRPTFFTEAVEAAFIREFPRSPLDIVSVAERALVGTPQEREPGCAVNIQQFYDTSPELKAKCLEHCEAINVDDNELPSKEQFAYEILTLARNSKNKAEATASDREFALRAYRLYCEIAGMITKEGSGGVNVQINNNTINKVMILPPEESLEEWSERSKVQQAKLIESAAVKSTSSSPPAA